MTLLAVVGLAYLVGAIPVGYLVGRAFGIGDIRRHGSGTIGATNVLRTVGKLPAVLTLVGDVVKGALAVALGGFTSGDGRAPARHPHARGRRPQGRPRRGAGRGLVE